MFICIAVLSNFHSAPAFPKCKSGTFNGDYRGVQGLSLRSGARNLPSVGFAILSAFQAYKKTLRLQKPSIPNIMGRRKKRAGMSAHGQMGSATGGQ